MHPRLQYVYAWLLQGPVGVPGLCGMVTDYAKCWVADVPHGTTFLIIGKRNVGKKTLLRDLLHRRSDFYKYGEINTRLDQVKQEGPNVNGIISKGHVDVWIGSKFMVPELGSSHPSTLITHARRFKTDVILCEQYALGIPKALRSNVDIVFRRRLYESFFECYYDNFPAFEADFAASTQDFGCLCLNRLKPEVLHFKADANLEPFSLSKLFFDKVFLSKQNIEAMCTDVS